MFHNLLHPDEPRHMDYDVVPHAVFSYPQVASAGMTERQVAADAVPFITATKPYSSTAYGWAMEDTTSFVKLIAHAQTRQLLGAHIIGEQASTLIQVLVQAMRFNQTVDEIATGQMWIHPALTEVIENAAPRPLTWIEDLGGVAHHTLGGCSPRAARSDDVHGRRSAFLHGVCRRSEHALARRRGAHCGTGTTSCVPSGRGKCRVDFSDSWSRRRGVSSMRSPTRTTPS